MLQAHLYSQDDQDHLEIREVFNVHIQLYEPCTQTFFFPEKKICTIAFVLQITCLTVFPILSNFEYLATPSPKFSFYIFFIIF